MIDTAGSATALTAAQLDQLRRQAEQTPHVHSGFVDPALLRRVQRWWRLGLHEWAEAVVGHGFDWRRVRQVELVLLDLAHDAEPTPPPPPKLTARRAAAQAAEHHQAQARDAHLQACAQEWAALRAALPVPVEVLHNYTSARHVEGFTQGADHIIVLADLTVARLHRPDRHPLCWTPSRNRDLRVFDGASGARTPTCQACVRTAYRITGRTPSRLLLAAGDPAADPARIEDAT
jgi:hypothetical protein